MVLRWLVECTTIWVWYQLLNQCNLLHLIAADFLVISWTCAITYFEGFGLNHPVFCSVCFSMRKKNGGHSSGFSRGIVKTLWFAEAVGWLAARPKPSDQCYLSGTFNTLITSPLNTVTSHLPLTQTSLFHNVISHEPLTLASLFNTVISHEPLTQTSFFNNVTSHGSFDTHTSVFFTWSHYMNLSHKCHSLTMSLHMNI